MSPETQKLLEKIDRLVKMDAARRERHKERSLRVQEALKVLRRAAYG